MCLSLLRERGVKTKSCGTTKTPNLQQHRLLRLRRPSPPPPDRLVAVLAHQLGGKSWSDLWFIHRGQADKMLSIVSIVWVFHVWQPWRWHLLRSCNFHFCGWEQHECRCFMDFLLLLLSVVTLKSSLYLRCCQNNFKTTQLSIHG